MTMNLLSKIDFIFEYSSINHFRFLTIFALGMSLYLYQKRKITMEYLYQQYLSESEKIRTEKGTVIIPDISGIQNL
jgi:hypothetical protein